MCTLLKSLDRLPLRLIALATMASATNLQLPQVQPIIGFSSSCTAAYSTRLPSCSFDDLLASVGGKNRGCSVSCISQLTELESIVQTSCQGERASRDTVIGQMFLGTVVEFLCGDDVGGGEPVATTSSTSGMATATTSMSTAEPVDTTTTSETSTSAEQTTTTDTAASTRTTLASSASTTAENSSTFTAQATASNSANQGGQGDTQTTFGGSGGGSPFDGGPGEFDGAAPRLSLQNSPAILLTVLASLLLVR